MVSAITLFAYLLQKQPEINWRELFAPLLALSLFTSPFGWIFDNASLLILHLSIIILAQTHKKRLQILGLVFGYQVLTAVLSITLIRYHHQFFWFPLGMLMLWQIQAQKTPETL